MYSEVVQAPSTETSAIPGHAFPKLTPSQLLRVAAHGRRRSTVQGEVLVEPGDVGAPLRH